MTDADMYDNLEEAMDLVKERFVWIMEEMRIFPELTFKDFEGIP